MKMLHELVNDPEVCKNIESTECESLRNILIVERFPQDKDSIYYEVEAIAVANGLCRKACRRILNYCSKYGDNRHIERYITEHPVFKNYLERKTFMKSIVYETEFPWNDDIYEKDKADNRIVYNAMERHMDSLIADMIAFNYTTKFLKINHVAKCIIAFDKKIKYNRFSDVIETLTEKQGFDIDVEDLL